MKRILKAMGASLFFLPDSVVRTIGFETFSYFGRLFAQPLKPRAGRNLVNLGCGPHTVSGWINVDFFGAKGIDYGADLRYPLRLETASVDGIFSEHTLEHLAFRDADRLLAECYRIMKSGARIRIVVPDVSLFIASYSSGDESWFAKWEKLYFTDSPDAERTQRRLGSPLEALSFVTQEYGHQSCWDFRTLSNHLRETGFVEIPRCSVMEGGDSALLVDQDEEDRKFISLYIEAAKA